MSGIGCTPKVNEVATPKLPPPPPFDDQSRSVWWAASAVTTVGAAFTTSTACRLSQVSPYLRPKTPIPPPRVRPAIPTVGHEPPGSSTPDAPKVLYTSINRAPAPTMAVSALPTATPAMGVTSITSPGPDE